MQTQIHRETVRKKYEERKSTVKPEVRSEVCNLCSTVTETFGVLSLFGVTHCYSYSKIKSVIIKCNSV
jgi:protein-arginine kinase activator protein McsA